ncbi:MAG: gamma-glutamyltransferase [bacterium]
MLTFFKTSFILLIFLVSGIHSECKDPVTAKNGMVVTASSLASEVGLRILKDGGNAIDAAVAVGFALAVTFPAAGNLGGGGFMVISLSDGQKTTFDFREKAPLKSFRDMYLDENGNYNSDLSLSGLTSSGVPGSVAGMIDALEKYGTKSLTEIIAPAIQLAEEGFPLDANLAESINTFNDEFNKYESSKKIFTKEGIIFSEGDLFIQKDLAATLKLIRDNGKDGFYKGKIADLLIEQSAGMNGYITHQDLEEYKCEEKAPVTGNYHGYEIVSIGPSSSGGIALIQSLNILENFSFKTEEWGSSSYIHHLVEALKFVYRDRVKYLGDEAFVKVPKEQLLSKTYAKKIAQKISDTAISSNQIENIYIPFESEETTHYSIVDKYGNAVSTTVTLNSAFGNKIIVEGAGFLLNNEMDDFSAKVGEPNQFGLVGSQANSIQPGKRMLSSMTPTIVLKNEKPYLIVGSPGGSTIITSVLQVILNCLDFGMNIEEAIDMPRIHHQWLPDQIDYEKFGLTQDLMFSLHAKGQIIGSERSLGRVEGIMINSSGTFFGATDTRGYGLAVGF